MMSQKEREYLKVLNRVNKKELKLSDASRMLGLSYRHKQRIYKRYRAQGDQGLVHRSRERKSNRAYPDEFRTTIIARYKTRYEWFGPTLGSEKLKEEDGYKVVCCNSLEMSSFPIRAKGVLHSGAARTPTHGGPAKVQARQQISMNILKRLWWALRTSYLGLVVRK